ncbi:MAG: BON domain-containing protein, partial [Acidobacteriaceae bacterium]
MQSTMRFSFPVLALATAMLFSSGCSSKPNDTQLTSNVQSAITADPALKGQSISVAATNGTVTLSGAVDAEATRELASRDAAGVKGTRTVVNNLSVAGAAPGGNPYAGNSAANQPPANSPAARRQTPPPPPARAAVPAPARAASQALVIPSGTRLRVRLAQTLSSNDSQTGEPFSGTLVNSVRADGQTLIPAGAQ